MPTEKDTILRSDDTTWSTYDNEVIILNLETGMYFTLNEVASRIWEFCDGSSTWADLVRVICEEYDVAPGRAKKDIASILDFFLEHKLVTVGVKKETGRQQTAGGRKKAEVRRQKPGGTRQKAKKNAAR